MKVGRSVGLHCRSVPSDSPNILSNMLKFNECNIDCIHHHQPLTTYLRYIHTYLLEAIK